MLFAVLVAAALALTACAGAPEHDASTPATPATTARAVEPAVATSPAAPVTSSSPAPTPTVPAAPPSPCATNTRAHYVYVSITDQHLWMCAGTTTAYDTGITSGMVGEYTNTPTGNFTIQSKVTNTTLNVKENGSYIRYPVKYWIPFDAPLFGFHDSSWQNFPYGSDQYKTDGSHGCVHVPLAAIAYLYQWAPIGTAVTIVP